MIIVTLARINRNEVGMILSKYNIPSLNLSPYMLSSLACGNILLMLHVIVKTFLFCKPSLYIVFFSLFDCCSVLYCFGGINDNNNNSVEGEISILITGIGL